MLFRFLENAIKNTEGADLDTQKFESAYYQRYENVLAAQERSLGWDARSQATAFGVYQILGENLARMGLSRVDLPLYLTDPGLQRRYARVHFYKSLNDLIRRRGLSWPHYFWSMWNSGINYNQAYAQRIKAYLSRN